MRSITLILMPLLFLSSCTIDWKDEKDKKITELENQIVQIRDENSKLTYSMSATLSTIDDEKRLKADIQYELEAITSDIYTELQDRMGKDNSLVLFPDSGTYTYKNEVFEGKNTGFCLIAKNNDRS